MGALKKSTCHKAPEAKKIEKPDPTANNVVQKAEIERMKKLITEKIKDPDLAKKAALIIGEMIDK